VVYVPRSNFSPALRSSPAPARRDKDLSFFLSLLQRTAIFTTPRDSASAIEARLSWMNRKRSSDESRDQFYLSCRIKSRKAYKECPAASSCCRRSLEPFERSQIRYTSGTKLEDRLGKIRALWKLSRFVFWASLIIPSLYRAAGSGHVAHDDLLRPAGGVGVGALCRLNAH
jgi:hypothetical protein